MHRRRSVRHIIGRYFGLLRKSQRTTISDLTLGLLRSARAGEAAIARGMLSATTVRHRIKRIWRFCKNPCVRPELVMLCLVRWLVPEGCPTVVALDWTYLTDYVMLAAKVAVAGRAVPVAWTVTRKGLFDKDKNSRNTIELDLIRRLHDAMDGRRWILVADRGFARADLIRTLQNWGVEFVIRAQTGTWAEMEGFSARLYNLKCEPGKAKRYDGIRYHKTMRVKVSLVTTHAEPAPEAWYLLTNVEGEARAICGLYRQRMWIEEAFRDAKGNLGLKKVWLATGERMERMMIVVALAMVIAILTGLKWRREHHGQDPQLTTKRKGHSLSVFLLGLYQIQMQGLPPGIQDEPLFIAMEVN